MILKFDSSIRATARPIGNLDLDSTSCSTRLRLRGPVCVCMDWPVPTRPGRGACAGRDEGVKRWNNPLRQFCTFLPVRLCGHRSLQLAGKPQSPAGLLQLAEMRL